MKITKIECLNFAKAVFKACDDGKVKEEKGADFLEWGHRMLDSLGPNDHVEVPVLMQGLYRDFQKSKDYAPGLEELMLQAEQRANYKPSEQGPGAEPNIWI